LTTGFAAGIDTLFGDAHIGEDALWRAGGTGDGIAVRIIRKAPDTVVGFGGSRAIVASVLIDVRAREIEAPAPNDIVEIAGAVFAIIAEPTADTLRLVWTCEAHERT
jgi:hypothetical protein